jgi:hypothetical protein
MQNGHHSYEATGNGTATCHCGDTMAGVIAIVGGNAYTELNDALAVNGTVSLVGDVQKNVSVTVSGVLDLNGFDILGDLAVAEGITLLVKDSQTDDFAVDDDNYGRITGTVTGAAAAESYVQITEADGTSFHKVTVALKTVKLRASCAGIYFTSEFNYDEVVARNLTAQGVTLSTVNAAPVADDSDASCLYTVGGNSVLLSGIMKESNTAQTNRFNARQAIYGRAYLLLNDGSYLYSEAVTTTLRDVVETIDTTLWNELSDAQKASLAEMYNTFSNAMDVWNIDNIKNYQA